MLKKFLSLILSLLFVAFWTGCGKIDNNQVLSLQNTSPVPDELIVDMTSPKENYTPLNYEYQKAMWMTYLDYKSMLLDKTEQEFALAVGQRMKNMSDFGLNTLYIHERAFGDAYYESSIFPSGEYCGSNLSFDPFEIIIEKAHELNISVHAWINPLRLQKKETMPSADSGYITAKWCGENNGYASLVNDIWYLNPAYQEVRELIYKGVEEIVSNYNVDGVHIDDYFYPTTDTAFDAVAFDKSGSSDLSKWRIDNINVMVMGIYDTVKAVDERILFGISPQANIDKDYSVQYADVRTWASTEGYCDYIVPQVYFGFQNENYPFDKAVSDWVALAENSVVKLIIGIGTYKIGAEDTWAGTGINEWQTDGEVASKQTKSLIQNENADGIAIYSYASTFTDNSVVNAERERISAVLNARETTISQP